MELIYNNPFRIAGVLANASTKEIQRNKTKISHYAGVGKAINFENDFLFLGRLDRNDKAAALAFAQLQQNKDKLKHSLFWFLYKGPHDLPAFSYLAQGDKDKAIEIWEKVINGREINSQNFSYFSNLGTLKLLSPILSDIQEGIGLKIKLIESSHFEKFVHLVADETFSIDKKIQANFFVDDLLQMYDFKYKGNNAISLFERCNGSTHQYLTQKLAEDPLHKVEFQIGTARNNRKSNKAGANEAGHNLYVLTQTDFSSLKSIIGEKDIRYKTIADNLAKEILQCAIDYFQHLKDSEDPSEKSLRLIRFASFIAVGPQLKERIQDNKESIEDWAQTAAIQKEIKFITTELSEFQNKTDTTNNAQQLIHKCKPKLLTIKSKLGVSDEFYLNISSAVVNNAQGMLVSVVNSEQEKLGTAYDHEKMLIFLKLKQVLQEAVIASNSLGTLDMNPDLRSRYNTNHSTLKNLVSQLGDPGIPAGRPTPRPTSRPNTSSGKTVETFSTSDGIPPIAYIIGVVILFIILANACS